MRRIRFTGLVVATTACSVERGGGEPVSTIDEERLPLLDDETIEARMAFTTLSDDLGYWLTRARNDAALTYYTGPDEPIDVARYLVESQWLTPDGMAGKPTTVDAEQLDFTDQDALYGCYAGDVVDWPTYDEGAMGSALAVLAILLRDHGDAWTFEHPDTHELRTMTQALDDAVRCSLRGQFVAEPEHADWLDGLWPQAPGWADGRAFFSDLDGRNVAGLLTFNDLSAEMTVEGLGVVYALLDRPYEEDLVEHIFDAADSTLELQERYRAALPEQADRDGAAAWGRGFEPPCVSSRATSSALKILNVAHALNDDTRWRDGAEDAVDWLERTELPDGTWEMYLDVDSLHPDEIVPVYGDGFYHLVYDRELASNPPPYFPYPAGYIYRWELYLRDFVDATQ